jgi:hypothetical protein
VVDEVDAALGAQHPVVGLGLPLAEASTVVDSQRSGGIDPVGGDGDDCLWVLHGGVVDVGSAKYGLRPSLEPSADWPFERAELFHGFGQTVTAGTRIDLRVVTHDEREVRFEIKSAKPNKGQCIEMKQRLMKAVAIRGRETTFAHWGVPYDPTARGTTGTPIHSDSSTSNTRS